MKYLIMVGWFCLSVVAGATEVHLKNYTGELLRFQDGNGTRILVPPGVSVFEFGDILHVQVGTTDSNMEPVELFDGGITEIVVGVHFISGNMVIAMAHLQGWEAFFVEGFGFGLVVFGFGFVLRIYKNIGKFNPEV